MTVESLQSTLLAVAVLGGVTVVLLSRLPLTRDRGLEPPRHLTDLACSLFLLVAGPMLAGRLHLVANPRWRPPGQDWFEFGGYLRWFQSGHGKGAAVGNRYPLYPWLANQWADFQQMDLLPASMQLSILAVGLMPAALYLLGRQLMPRPLALAGSLAPMLSLPLLERVGPPTDYLLYCLLHILVLGTGAAALTRGGRLRFLAFGAALALLMASAAKSLLLLLLAVPAAFVGLAWHHRSQLGRGLVAAVLFTSPMVAMWTLYGSLDMDFHSLEALQFRSQLERAEEEGAEVAWPDEFGWDPTKPPEDHGWWRVGDPDALRNLPETLTFLTRERSGNLSVEDRRGSILRGLAEEVPYGSRALHLALLGCLAAGSVVAAGRRRDRLVPWVLAAGFVAAAHLSFFQALTGALYEERYALPLIICLPLMVLAGIALPFRVLAAPGPWRDSGLPWWPLAGLLLAWGVKGEGTLGWIELEPRLDQLAEQREQGHYAQLWAVAARPRGTVVVDLVDSALLPLCLPRHRILGSRGRRSAYDGVRGERFIVEPCLFNFDNPPGLWLSEDPERLEPLGRCIFRDLQPEEPLVMVQSPDWRPP